MVDEAPSPAMISHVVLLMRRPVGPSWRLDERDGRRRPRRTSDARRSATAVALPVHEAQAGSAARRLAARSRITAPSPMKAALSRQDGSSSAPCTATETGEPRWPAASASASGDNLHAGRQGAELRQGRARNGRPRTGPGRPGPRKAMASRPPPRRAAEASSAKGASSRIRARRSVYLKSSTRRCGRPFREGPKASARAASPGSGLRGVEQLEQRGFGRRPHGM